MRNPERRLNGVRRHAAASDETGISRRRLLAGLAAYVGGAAVLGACNDSRETEASGATTRINPNVLPDGNTTTLPAATATTPTSSGTAGSTAALPEKLAVIPQEYWSPAQQQGTLVELRYETFESTTYEQGTERLTKRAIVYLPYGYNADKRHDVFYVMHGGWGNETTTLGTLDESSEFKNVLDNAIAAGEIGSLIVVCPTCNNTSPQDSASFSLALTLNQNYHHELLNDLLPVVESAYSTYAEDLSADGLIASRDHRGFGGFSMGAVATWRTFQNGLDYFRYFLPMSCGTSLDMDNILASAQNHDEDSYFVWIITGTDDFAHPYDQARVDLLRDSASFTEAGTEHAGNFAFSVKEGYTHDGVAATEYTYNGMRWFWSP